MSSLAVWSVGGLYYAFNVVYRKSHNSYHFPGILSHYFSKWNELSSLLCIIIAFVSEITTILFMEGCENHMGFRYNSCWHGIHPNPYMHFHWWSAWGTENDVALASSAQNIIHYNFHSQKWSYMRSTWIPGKTQLYAVQMDRIIHSFENGTTFMTVHSVPS